MISSNVIRFIYTINIFLFTNGGIEDNEIEKVPTVNDVADTLIKTLGIDMRKPPNKRLEELKAKLKKIEDHVIDKHKYAEILMNETLDTSLNETNFFKAMKEPDVFQMVLDNEPKNLYLKLKEKMNRDDIEKLLSDSKSRNKIHNSARRSMGDYFENSEEVIDLFIDKIIAEAPSDDHKYDVKDLDQKYWDPQGELEDLNEYHRGGGGRRIFRGERTTIRYYPFMVSIHVMGLFWCGGVIYWHDLVITSAACLQLMHNNRFFRENPRVLMVRVGSNHSRIGGEEIEASEVYFHPGYNPRTLRHNIALVRLRRHIFFNYHRVPKLIDISHSSNLIPHTAEVMLLGWGVTKSSQKLYYEPVFLQRKLLPVYPNTFCRQVYGDKFITKTMFCAGTMTTGEGACDHDAGGPAIMHGKVVGIISFGPTICGFPNTPTVFTLIGAYADWIETINETMPEYYRGRKRTTTTQTTTLYNTLPHTHASNIIKPVEVTATRAEFIEVVTTTPEEVTETEAATESEVDTGETTPQAMRLRHGMRHKGPFVNLH